MTPLLPVDTAGVNDPPGIAEVGRFEIVGVSDPVAPAVTLPATWKPTMATMPLKVITNAPHIALRRRRVEGRREVEWLMGFVVLSLPGFQGRRAVREPP